MGEENHTTSDSGFVRIVWCDNANLIRAKSVYTNNINLVHSQNIAKNNNFVVGISRGQQGVPVVYDGVVPKSGLDPVGEITLKGDMATFTPLPYAPGHFRVMGDMFENDNQWDNCPRGFLKKIVVNAKKMGFEVKSAFENEFYLLEKNRTYNTYKTSDLTPFASTYAMDINYEVIKEMVEALIAQGMVVEQYYPESGPGQHEITVKYADSLKSADNQIAFRETIKAVAYKHGLIASFLPKIFPDAAGSGCHIHLSLWKDDVNILHHAGNKYGLSKEGNSFIAGILNHLPALMAITTPTPRSYRRLRPNTWSGAFKAWGFNNREASIRVIRENNGEIKHFEVKTVDATANPYLALGSIIAAGLDGVKMNMELPEPVQKDPAIFTCQELKEKEITPLPHNLSEALNNLKNNKTIQDALGPALFRSYLAVKEEELSLISKLDSKDELELLFDKY